MNARSQAARALARVVRDGCSLTEALGTELSADEARQRALAQELAYGSLRWYYALAAILGRMLQKPLKRRDTDVYCLLLAGLYQLSHTGVPAHVAVHETVQACRDLGKEWAAGLVNAVLRNFQRQAGQSAATAGITLQERYAHPDWLIRLLQKERPDHWEAILLAGNRRPPFSLRVNRRRCSRAAWIAELHTTGIRARPLAHTTHGVLLESALPVSSLPGFADGKVSVQDGAAQLAAELLDLHAGQRVLDACAAPGGKTAHILECEPDLAALTAVDIDARRAGLIRENLGRLGLTATVHAADAADPGGWWDGQAYDRILLDVPCSATGVIRRHPDIKLLRRPQDLHGLVIRQEQLLAAVWPLVSAGGMLLYSTCSVLGEENEQQISRFLSAVPEATDVTPAAPWGRAMTCGRQVYPGEDDMDGFYYACLYKAR